MDSGPLIVEAFNRNIISGDEFLSHFSHEALAEQERHVAKIIYKHLRGLSPEGRKKEWAKITKNLDAIVEETMRENRKTHPNIAALSDAQIFSKLRDIEI